MLHSLVIIELKRYQALLSQDWKRIAGELNLDTNFQHQFAEWFFNITVANYLASLNYCGNITDPHRFMLSDFYESFLTTHQFIGSKDTLECAIKDSLSPHLDTLTRSTSISTLFLGDAAIFARISLPFTFPSEEL